MEPTLIPNPVAILHLIIRQIKEEMQGTLCP